MVWLITIIALTFAEVAASLPSQWRHHTSCPAGLWTDDRLPRLTWYMAHLHGDRRRGSSGRAAVRLDLLGWADHSDEGWHAPTHVDGICRGRHACGSSSALITWVGIKLFARVNSVLTWIKIALIIVVTVALFILSFEWTMFDDIKEGGFAPDGWSGIFRAMAYGGVIYAFTGFQHAAVAAGESKNPHRDVPIAVIGSILICLVFYIFVQAAFIGAMRETDMPHGWSSLKFDGQVGPLAGLAMTLGVTWLFIVIFAGAIASPLGAGLINLGSSMRIVRGMSHDAYLPRRLGRLGRFQTPGLVLVLVVFLLDCSCFFRFQAGRILWRFLASVVVVAYAMGPLCLLALRKQLPDHKRPFMLPIAHLICPIAFMICGLLIYWAGWTIVWKLGVTFGACALIFILVKVPRGRNIDFKGSLWIWPFLGGLVGLTWLGGHGGIEVIPFGWDIISVAGWSLLCYLLGLCLRIPS